MLTRKNAWGAIGWGIQTGFLVVGILFAFHVGCEPPEPDEIVSRGLKDNEREKIEIKPGRIEHYTKLDDGRIERKTEYRPPEAKTEVVIDNDGRVSITSRRWGACFSPGVGINLDIERRILVDVKLFYYSRWGLVAGLPVTKFTRSWEGPYAAVSYNVYKGTGLFLGYAPLGARPIAGLRVSF